MELLESSGSGPVQKSKPINIKKLLLKYVRKWPWFLLSMALFYTAAKIYLRYTGYPGGQREITPARLMAKPNGAEKLMKRVVKGMLPKNRLGAKLLGNLYVYEGSEHKHEAQTPKVIDINTLK